MKKRFIISLFAVFCSIGIALSQERINEFVVNVDETHNPMTIYSSYGATPNDGVVIVNSTIPNLEFNIPAAPGRIRTVPDKKKNRYVLIIQPNDSNYKQYTITINAKGFKQGQINSVVVKAGLSTGYVINPKHGANKNVDPLYVEGWSIYKNGKRLGDNEIRSLFANTPAYGQYEKGLGIYESTFWNKDDRWGLPTSKGIAYTFLACGGTMVILGYSFASLSDDENDVESMKKFGAAGLVATGIG